MKKNKLVILGLFLLLTGMSTQLIAQSNLEAWVKKAENMKDVNVTVITDRDRNTKKETSKMVSISFRKNTTLVSELRAAAVADVKSAVKIIENKVSGVLSPQIYEFYDSTTKLETKYIFSFDKDGSSASLVVKTDFKRRVFYKRGEINKAEY